jgi:adenylate kinase
MIALDVEENILKERIRERGKTSGRADDQDEAKIETRLRCIWMKLYLLQYYEKQGKFTKINGVGTVDGIFLKILRK